MARADEICRDGEALRIAIRLGGGPAAEEKRESRTASAVQVDMAIAPERSVSDLKVALAEVDRLRAELQSQARLLAEIAERSARARDRAARAEAEKAELMGLISHHLRTPLNAVIGFSDVMHRELLGPLGHGRYRDYAGHIRESGQMLLSAAEDIMALSRLDGDIVPMEQDTFDLGELLSELRWAVRPFAEAGPEVVQWPADPSIEVTTDRRALLQALYNLITEMASATPGGCLQIDVLHCDGDIRIDVTSIAPLGPDAPRTSLAEGDATKRSVTAALIELLGGRFMMSSAPIIGCTTASCLLPLTMLDCHERLLNRRPPFAA
jgi:signal transduction histidine kinase